MSNAGVKSSDVKAVLMANDDFRNEYAKLKPQYDKISQRINQLSDYTEYQKEMFPSMCVRELSHNAMNKAKKK